MNYLGIDYGEKRIGLSFGDDDVCLAVPIDAAVEPTPAARLEHIGAQIRQRRVGELVVGYPYNMDGSVGFKAREVDAFIDTLSAAFGLPIHRTDERLTSADAQARMKSAAGKGRRGANARQVSVQARLAERRSGTLDSRAAALILQDYLDTLPQRGMGLLFPQGDCGDDFCGDSFDGTTAFADFDSGALDNDSGNARGNDSTGDLTGNVTADADGASDADAAAALDAADVIFDNTDLDADAAGSVTDDLAADVPSNRQADTRRIPAHGSRSASSGGNRRRGNDERDEFSRDGDRRHRDHKRRQR